MLPDMVFIVQVALLSGLFARLYLFLYYLTEVHRLSLPETVEAFHYFTLLKGVTLSDSFWRERKVIRDPLPLPILGRPDSPIQPPDPPIPAPDSTYIFLLPSDF